MIADSAPVPEDPGHYDAAYYAANGQAGDRPALRWYTRMVRRYVGAGPYLDFGCGTGHLLRRLSALGSASGLETSPWAAGTARMTAPGCTVYLAMDEVPQRAFGGLTAIHVMEHIDDATATAVLAGWRRVLVPGGRALVVTPDPAGKAHALAGPKWSGFADPTHVNLKPHADWRRFFDEGGFTVLREGSDGLWNVPYATTPRLLDAAVHALPALAQFLAGRLFLPPGSGESSVFLVEARR
jgi:SAM-dependent methyltransferase